MTQKSAPGSRVVFALGRTGWTVAAGWTFPALPVGGRAGIGREMSLRRRQLASGAGTKSGFGCGESGTGVSFGEDAGSG